MPLSSRLAGKAAGAIARPIFLRALNRISTGTLTVRLDDGSERTYKGAKEGPSAVLNVHDDAFFTRIIRHGEIGFGEAFVDGLCSSPDLVALVSLAIINRRGLNLNAGPLRVLSRLANRRMHLGRANTVDQAKENIHEHYDLGNDFFGLWLDDTMTYSSALFAEPGQELREAQLNKYRALCTLAGIGAESNVLEIGTGWGGFAMLAAQEYGCHVTTVTISKEQHDLAVERIAAAGLSERIDVVLSDYRDITGTFDAIVSIEMFEAVGAEYFATFFEKCGAVLAPGGRLAMQVITVPDAAYPAQRDGVNWIQKYIFPGGVLPSVEEMERSSAGSELVLKNYTGIGLHYATTLHQWRERFWDAIDQVRALGGYDERFINTWDYYLAICEAGFLTGLTDDVHIVFEKPA